MRIVLGKIDAAPAVGNEVEVKIKSNLGTVYDLRMNADRAKAFVESIEQALKGLERPVEAPAIAAPAEVPEVPPAPPPEAPPPPLRKATQAPKATRIGKWKVGRAARFRAAPVSDDQPCGVQLLRSLQFSNTKKGEAEAPPRYHAGRLAGMILLGRPAAASS